MLSMLRLVFIRFCSQPSWSFFPRIFDKYGFTSTANSFDASQKPYFFAAYPSHNENRLSPIASRINRIGEVGMYFATRKLYIIKSEESRERIIPTYPANPCTAYCHSLPLILIISFLFTLQAPESNNSIHRPN